MGVATQCMKSVKCFRAKPQYYANVCLKSVRILWALVIVLLTTLQDQRQARWYQHNPGSSVRHRSDRPSKPDDCHGLANILWQSVPLLMLCDRRRCHTSRPWLRWTTFVHSSRRECRLGHG